MSSKQKFLIGFGLFALIATALVAWLIRGNVSERDIAELTGPNPVLEAPETEFFPTIAIAKPIGWEKDAAPVPGDGLQVSRFAEGLDHPRVLYTLPNGDVLATLSNAPEAGRPSGVFGRIMMFLMRKAGAGAPSPDQIMLLRDADGDGVAEDRYLFREGLSSPSGLGYHDGRLFVATHDALLSFAFEPGMTSLAGEPQKLMDLPAAGHHWMRNLIISPDKAKIFIAVGSASNIAEGGMEAEEGRAAIWEYDLTSKSSRLFASGLRNPNGLAFNPSTDELWTTVNERDMLGPDLVPDYLTNVPVGAQYGWPWVYWKDLRDYRVKAPIPQYFTEYTRKPEYALGPHVAALGLVFAQEGHRMGPGFANGAFIARHGSWNRRPPAGYDVIFVPFDANGNPDGAPQPVLSGFLTDKGDTQGRPTWVAWDQTGALLVSDDTAGIIWRVQSSGAAPAPAPPKVQSTPLPARRELSGNPTGSFRQEEAR